LAAGGSFTIVYEVRGDKIARDGLRGERSSVGARKEERPLRRELVRSQMKGAAYVKKEGTARPRVQSVHVVSV
jgi:hypothetical protein